MTMQPHTKTQVPAIPLPLADIVTTPATVKASHAPKGIIAKAVVKITNINAFGTPAKK
jgi:hypothetical protein